MVLSSFGALDMTTSAMQMDPVDEFERLWQNQHVVPDLFQIICRLPPDTKENDIAEMVITDLCRRWAHVDPQLRLGLADYDSRLPMQLSHESRARILCWEFAVRNQYGDCISREQISKRYPDLEKDFLAHVAAEIDEVVDWPSVQILNKETVIQDVQLDRPITAGRQADSQQRPWTVQTDDYTHHLVLCDQMNPALSRRQLTIRMESPGTVQIQNTSSARAIAIRGKQPLDAGESAVFELKRVLNIHLYEGYDIRIIPQHE